MNQHKLHQCIRALINTVLDLLLWLLLWMILVVLGSQWQSLGIYKGTCVRVEPGVSGIS